MRVEVWNGCNNRFVIIYSKKKVKVLSADQIVVICKRFSVDGLILVYKKEYVNMEFFNPDGSRDNCGNGLRVVAAFAYRKGLVGKAGIIISLGAAFPFRIGPDEVSVIVRNIRADKDLLIVGGVPHKVIEVESFIDLNASSLRYEHNANITFVKRVGDSIFAKTFETGVEGFTNSCGTGAIAAFLVMGKSRIFMPGGLLSIERLEGGVSLSGRIMREGSFSYNG